MQVTRRLSALLTAVALFMAMAAPIVATPSAYAQAPAAEAGKAPTPPAAKAAKEVVENPYGLEAMWKQGDWVSKGTLLIMIIMSVGSWYIIFAKVLEQRKLFAEAKAVRASFWDAGSVSAGASNLKETSPYRFLADSAVEATKSHAGKVVAEVSFSDWILMNINRAADNISSRMQDGLSFLATVGSTAPFVGLFGTVWGIYHALTAIGVAGQASIDKVAGPVGEALIMTAIGLAVAVPAVLGYNWLVRRNKVALEQIRGFRADVHLALLKQGRG